MKILILNTYKSKGGAARAAKRLYDALLMHGGIDVQFLHIYKEKFNLLDRLTYLFRVAKDRLPGVIVSRKLVYFSTGGFSNKSIIKKINSSDVDLVHLHWINAGALSLTDLADINKPIVWSLHDMWPFTGGCHYDDHCNKYKTGCGSCPALNSDNIKDISRKHYDSKFLIYKKNRSITVVGLSEWIAQSAKSSLMFKNTRVINLPNPIDVDVFFPEDKELSKSRLGLIKNKKVILFGAMSGKDDKRKGYSELLKALTELRNKDTIQLAVFGGMNESKMDLGIPATYLGHVYSDADLRAIYSCADVLVVPSLQENLSNVIMESLSCGLPVVAFDIGGNGDLIIHKITGYLAKEKDHVDMAKGIEWVIDNSNELGENSRKLVNDRFSYNVVSRKYLDLYKNILQDL